MSSLIDRHGRKLEYLRVSLTSACNLRCLYCMPDVPATARSCGQRLSTGEIVRVIAAAVAVGVKKVRLTGGEPLLYPELPKLLCQTSKIAGLQEITLTTNGILLGQKADELAALGLNRVNVSLDSLRDGRFRQITGGGGLAFVLAGIDVARKAGLNPVKINTVVMRGINDDEIGDFARFAQKEDLEVRFIEFMPIGTQKKAWQERYVPLDEVEAACRLAVSLWKTKTAPGSSAVNYRIGGGRGAVGFISPLSRHFCGECNRLRVTADGKLRPCLFSDLEFDLRPALERKRLVRVFQRAAAGKPAGMSLANVKEETGLCGRSMFQIGG